MYIQQIEEGNLSVVLSELTVNIRLAVTIGYFNFGYESEKSTV